MLSRQFQHDSYVWSCHAGYDAWNFENSVVKLIGTYIIKDGKLKLIGTQQYDDVTMDQQAKSQFGPDHVYYKNKQLLKQ